MTPEERFPRGTAWHFWRRNGLVWAVLMALLMLSLVLAYVPLGKLTAAPGIVIAFAKAGLVVALFMELLKSKPLVRLAALSGLVFVAIMFALTLADVLSRQP